MGVINSSLQWVVGVHIGVWLPKDEDTTLELTWNKPHAQPRPVCGFLIVKCGRPGYILQSERMV